MFYIFNYCLLSFVVSPTTTFYGDYAESDDPDSSLELFWADLLESSMKNDTSVCGEIFLDEAVNFFISALMEMQSSLFYKTGVLLVSNQQTKDGMRDSRNNNFISTNATSNVSELSVPL
jgi:calmodulin-binding transcription activator